ncbi:MAG: hypothetical protein GEU74_01595 [Nitriliruptorales bacterium]|nr:hypothetical protein [Nitriliruptorales bacterium]
MRKLFVLGTALGMLVALLPGPAAAACATQWGSLKKTNSAHPDSVIVTARAGEHACFDRLVVELDGKAPGYVVRYVKKFVPDASGRVVELRGAATLQITMLGARAHDDEGRPTYAPARRREMLPVRDYRTFRQAYWGGTFEGTTVVGLGVRARLPFRVFKLKGPGSHSRLVIDVAHRW